MLGVRVCSWTSCSISADVRRALRKWQLSLWWLLLLLLLLQVLYLLRRRLLLILLLVLLLKTQLLKVVLCPLEACVGKVRAAHASKDQRDHVRRDAALQGLAQH